MVFENSNNAKKRNEAVRELDIRNTQMRQRLVTFFQDNPGLGFSENEIRQELDAAFDRTTVYRTIKTLLEKVFIHKIVCENGMLKYALNEKKDDYLPHVHFQCVQCQRVFCLKECKVQTPELPDAFEAQSYQFLIKGNCHHCPDCIKKTQHDVDHI